jgi:hypothetical protein
VPIPGEIPDGVEPRLFLATSSTFQPDVMLRTMLIASRRTSISALDYMVAVIKRRAAEHEN